MLTGVQSNIIKNGFDFLTDEDIEDDTRAMYYDLMKLGV
jgi:hypothetical protein